MPVAPSSLISVPEVGQIDSDAQSIPGQKCGLVARFRSIADPRQASKVRHTLEAILAVMTFGTTVVGGDSIAAIIEWAEDAPQDLPARLGCWGDPLTGVHHPPSECTLRRVLADVDGNEVDRQTAAYLGESAAPTDLERADDGAGAGTGDCDAQPLPKEREARRAVQRSRRQPPLNGMLASAAFDGKAMRGARLPGGGRVHLLSLFEHERGAVPAQRQAATKTTEVPELAPLLDDAKGAGMVLTGDALHTVRETARHLVEDLNSHYLLIVKDNQPTLLTSAAHALTGTDAMFAARTDTTDDRGHGRTETRVLRTAPADGIDFPGAAQVLRIVRYRGDLDGVRASKEVVFGVTSIFRILARLLNPLPYGVCVRS
ncbi:ISAs1 family transposase [Sphaerisporangium perillae]|uniref:ISAs1 family transposase n=1 Tax=Sphaerisporangium perillae TaxID=2935860 RepID=UPI0027DF34A7|nr:ISAs1 family transposase [Sphaerisporangium perillae]